ncbi:hypothetical protein GS501_04900 [Saccharibacter sp. 17.LH.SD]|uniref:hypothetical protein n=1 Tax=Saccharibacter sp. 17.LH.SD TaxID=2689393 RepID=UPI0013713BBB|nr:hypothetical protein [Saccharibacter sp. 17.LH.SD]MXV44385.1 hypothetical protein [Saccharibacter sp. 17.LH.SD]
MTSLQLDADIWDIGLDGTGNLALATGQLSVLQDVCSAVQTWLGEVIYDLNLGVPYSDELMGGSEAIAFYASDVEDTAGQVPGVSSATCYSLSLTPTRRLTGVLAVTMTNGETDYVAF